MALTTTEAAKLRNIGITRVSFDTIKTTEVTTRGLWHLFNFRQGDGYSGWKWGLREAKALVAYDFKVKSDRPAVTILLTDMPVHEDAAMYKRLSIYAHHSPITTIQDFPPMGSIRSEFSVCSSEGDIGCNALGLWGNWRFTIKFTDEELATLLREGSLTICH